MELNKQTRLAHLDDAMASHQDLNIITLMLRWLDRLVGLPDHGQMIQLGECQYRGACGAFSGLD